MNSDKIKSAEKMIDASVILRLFISAIYALLMAYLASKDVWFLRLGDGVILLLPVIIVFFMDTIFTLLWKASFILYVFHLVCYILFGGIFYIIYFSLTFDWALDHIVFFWVIGLIPFVIYVIGSIKRKKAWKKMTVQI